VSPLTDLLLQISLFVYLIDFFLREINWILRFILKRLENRHKS
jgi:hypothetical protein